MAISDENDPAARGGDGPEADGYAPTDAVSDEVKTDAVRASGQFDDSAAGEAPAAETSGVGDSGQFDDSAAAGDSGFETDLERAEAEAETTHAEDDRAAP